MPYLQKEIIGDATLFLGNCELSMSEMTDNQFDLAIIDPPYGIDITNQSQGKGGGVAKKIEYEEDDWDKKPPGQKYFDELFRVSKNQIIWGANHFISKIPFDSSCWIVWDKVNGSTDFADCELAWTSFDSAVRKFSFLWSGMLQGNMKNKEKRTHPTQKPVALYRWLLKTYAKKGDLILDTHGGSLGSAVACQEMGFNITAFEINQRHFNLACERLKQTQRQGNLFTPPKQKPEERKLF